jgi:peroxiredoxin
MAVERTRRRKLAVAGWAIVGAVVVAALWRLPEGWTTRVTALGPGFSNAPAPDIAYTLLDGQSQRLDALRGHVLLVNFWATSCVTCVAEMPQLVATQTRLHQRGLRTLAVAMAYDAPANVVRFVQNRQLPLPVVIDNLGTMARAFGDVQATPTTFVIDRQGIVVQRIVGAPDFKALDALLDKLLAQS